MNKKELRIKAQKRRKELSVYEVSEKSNEIMDRLIPLLEGKKVIGIYMPLENEVDVTSLLFMYDSLGIPKIRNNEEMDFFLIHGAMDVEVGTFGVLEPTTNVWIKPEDFEVIIVPAVAFDKNKHRIGHGRGYYDRYLTDLDVYKIGICFKEQIGDDIPIDKYDVKMDELIVG